VKLYTWSAKVRAKASNSSGEGLPLFFISFLLSRTICSLLLKV